MDQYLAMNETEQGEALKYLAKIIKSGIFKVSEESTQGIKDGFCYISSGDVEGIYFPNTIIKETERSKVNHPNYNIIALAKNESGVVGVVYALKDDIKPSLKKFFNNYIFESLENIYYSFYEREALNELKNNIKELEKDNYLLSMIKYQTKKDGSNFKELTKNIMDQPCENITVKATQESGSKITLYFSETLTSKNGEAYNNYFNINLYKYNKGFYNGFYSVDDLKTEIKNTIKSNNERIEAYKNDIKNIKNIFSIVNSYKNHIKGLTGTTKQYLIKALENVY